MSAFERVARILESCSCDDPRLPPTELYNEGWMLRLVLDWFEHAGEQDHLFGFAPGARWFSEALLPSRFLARHRGDALAESWTHADGVVGHFELGAAGRADVTLAENATQFVVVEAKMFSKLSAGVTNAPTFNQAARNVACIAEVLHRAHRSPTAIESLAFVIAAPAQQIEAGVFAEAVARESVDAVVRARVDGYQGGPDHDALRAWLNDWFAPTLAAIRLECVSWESLCDYVAARDSASGECTRDFLRSTLEQNASRRTE